LIERRRSPKIFFGWWTVLATGVLSIWGWGFQLYGFSALFKPIAFELGFSRAVTSVAASIGRLEGGIEAPLAGWLTDKFGPKWVIIFGVCILSIGLVLMNFIDSLWSFYIVWGIIIGTGANTALSIPADKAITNWFVKKRGLAISIRRMFSGLLLLPLVTWLIATQGWRMTCVIGGLVMLFLGSLLTWFLVKRERPEYYGLLPDGATVEIEQKEDADLAIERGVEYAAEVQELEFTLRQAMKTPAYWLLIMAQATFGMTVASFIIHLIPFLTDLGIDPARAAAIVMIAGLFSIASRFLGGFLADRVSIGHLRFVYGGSILLQSVGITIFLLSQTVFMVYPFLILYYIGMGINLVLLTVIGARYFGRKAFGSIRGFSVLATMPFGILGPIYLGWIYDTTGSYVVAFTLFAVLLALTTLLVFLARPPKPPVRITDIREIV